MSYERRAFATLGAGACGAKLRQQLLVAGLSVAVAVVR